MLGIDSNSEEYQNLESMYWDVIKNHQPESQIEASVLKQIEVDVYRTFRPFNLKFLSAKIDSGKNKLYNLLKVYALILDP